jgi:GDP-4-dehydro-6-deoxy-D-mannose reductase
VDLAVQDLADQLLAQARIPLRFETDPELLRPVEVPVLRGSHDRLTDATGWQPEIPIDQTLTDLLEDWRARVAAER